MKPSSLRRASGAPSGSRTRAGVAGFAALLLCGPVSGSVAGPMTWVVSSYEDFSAGELESVSLDGDGRLRLGAALDPVGDTGEAFVWAVDQLDDGTVLAAAGTDGRIFRFAPGSSDPVELFDADGTIHAMVAGPDDHLYAAVSPGGAVWRLPLDGRDAPESPWFTTETRYVWDLVFAPDGTLYAGTGDSGVIFKVAPDGTGEALYDANETHVTSLAIDAEGNVLAGSADGGHLYRLSPSGDVFVLFDAPMKQITGIVPTDAGIYFSAMEAGPDGDAAGDADSSGPAIGGSTDDSPKGVVYRLSEDGLVEQLWGSADETAHSLAPADAGVVVGTGDEGRLLRVGPGRQSMILADAEGSQITAARARGGSVVLGTSNLGRIYRMRPAFRGSGAYVSAVKDTATTSQWGRLRWRSDGPGGTTLRFHTRSGNTGEPDETWSDWQGPLEDPAGSPIASPPARFVQWKAELATDDDRTTPVLEWVELVYVPRNLRPEVEDFVVHPAGVIYRQNTSFEDGLPIGRLPSSVREELARRQGRNGPSPAGGSGFLGQAYYLPGSQTFTWDTSDANGDEMAYSLWYRGEGETAWKPIAEDVTESLWLWDTTTVPDGLYRARITASDGPSNPAGVELEGSRDSQPFVVDNTAPQIDNLSAAGDRDGVRVGGIARDATSLIRAMEYAVDGGEWHAVLPGDGLPDAGEETIDFTTMTLEPGEHTIVVRVTDNALNRGTARVIVTVR